jgi:hypothetical protein
MATVRPAAHGPTVVVFIRMLEQRRSRTNAGFSLNPGVPMTTISSATNVVHVELVFTDAERAALAGFLAGYSGLTRDAYAVDLRQYGSWCQQHGLRLFQARRPDIECFGRDMEAGGRARATIARRVCTVSGLPLRRGRGVARALPPGPRPAAAPRLRVEPGRPGVTTVAGGGSRAGRVR